MIRKHLARTCVAALAVGALATPAAAFADQYYFANGVTLYSGGDKKASGYRGDIEGISGRGQPTAYTGVWIVNSGGSRISADAYCNTASCTAGYYWGPAPAGPSGYGNVHNHGNGSPNSFTSFVQFQ